MGTTHIRPGTTTFRTGKDNSKTAHNDTGTLGVVYVNEVGRESMKNGNAFPVGSVIVREKPAATGRNPELLAVMIKREKGFNSPGGDWLFLTFAGDARRVKSQQRRGSCLNCHQSQRKTDFVYPLSN